MYENQDKLLSLKGALNSNLTECFFVSVTPPPLPSESTLAYPVQDRRWAPWGVTAVCQWVAAAPCPAAPGSGHLWDAASPHPPSPSLQGTKLLLCFNKS